MTINAPHGPLTGLRVLEIGHFIAAPFCTRILGDMGADVIKIEPPEGDPVRGWGDQVNGHSVWWSLHGRNKRSVTLNLKAKGAAALLLDLIRECDVVVENFRPGQLARMGLGDDVMRGVRPDLVISHISGYGQDGPYRDRAAFGVIGEAIGGLRHLSDHAPGTTDLPPVRVGVSIGDSLAGLYAAFGIVSALWQRDRAGGDGAGRTMDVALTEAVLSMMEGVLPEYGAFGKVRQPTGSRIPTAAPSSAYPTADGKWMLIAANSAPLFDKLSKLIGRPDLPQDDRFTSNLLRVKNVVALDELIADWSRQLPVAEVERLLKEHDIPSTQVYTAAEIASDPQFQHRNMVRRVDDPLIGQPVLHQGVVPHVPDNPGTIRWTGPAIGQHTDEVLAEIGRSAEDIAKLRSEGVI
ncbi:CaiB/BaiF CoA transferase family protein [Ruixingdingia sedimenti]|uniref:CoA transferase n=1 Tax=Ruixingdingia sedimenti TaxID=3073604 RepID=A0ABU1F2Y8_9RHOB|nr:CoA transferase [Xinfangfangia sp. LG-4]MDR5651194.1 CoA transferase [Xinfangfangia sp. LG-4]